ncbi:MAG: hypothetical protein RIQ60_2338 [Pseudomonadota bacterium]
MTYLDHPLGLRARLTLLMLGAFAALGALLAWHLVLDHEARLDAARDDLLHEARLVAARQSVLVERADAVLNALMLDTDVPPRGAAVGAGQLPARATAVETTSSSAVSQPAVALASSSCPPALAQQLAQLLVKESDYVQVGIARPNGDLVCAGVPPRTPVNLADREWFRRTLNAHDIVVGDVVVSRVVGKPGVTLSKARHDGVDDALTGVYYVGLNLDWISRSIARSRLRDGLRVSVIDGQGALVARFPDPERWSGTPIAGVVGRKILSGPAEGLLEEYNRAGELRLIAHVPLLVTTAGTTYHLLVSVPQATVATPSQQAAAMAFAALSLVLGVTALALLLATHRWVLNPLATLVQTAERLRSGDSQARSGLAHDGSEIGSLAQALDESSAAIHDREQRLFHNNRALRVLSAGNRTLLTGHDEQALLEQMCHAIVEAGGFRLAWVAYVEANGELRLKAAGGGVNSEVLEALQRSCQAADSGGGPLGRTVRSGQVQVWSRSHDTPQDAVWSAAVQARGCAATLTLPVQVDGATVMGVLNICDGEADVFEPRVIEVLQEAARDLALGLRVARSEVERQRLVEQLRHHRDELEHQVDERTAALAVAKDAAEAASRAKSAFLANMSHEIRTPLNAILGLNHLLARDTHDARQRDRLGKVGTAARHLLQILNDILDLSRIEAGRMVLVEADFDRDDWLTAALDMVGAAASAKGLELVLKVGELPARLHGDRTRLTQSLANLLSNAVKFTDAGWVSVSAELQAVAPDGRLLLRVEVSDTGIGIPLDAQAGLFSAFAQADASSTREHGGTGLGLALTRHLATLMGGEVGLSSRPGAGTSVWFSAWVGRAVAPTERAETVAASPAPAEVARPGRALLVDDCAPALDALAHGLASLGWQVQTQADAAAALAAADAATAAGQRFDLLVLDAHLARSAASSHLPGSAASSHLPASPDVPAPPLPAATPPVGDITGTQPPDLRHSLALQQALRLRLGAAQGRGHGGALGEMHGTGPAVLLLSARDDTALWPEIEQLVGGARVGAKPATPGALRKLVGEALQRTARVSAVAAEPLARAATAPDVTQKLETKEDVMKTSWTSRTATAAVPVAWADTMPAEDRPKVEGVDEADAEAVLKRRHQGRRVLLVEDNPINQQVARELLAEVGLQVDLAPDGRQAVDKIDRQSYDLVLMDMQMPVMDGVTATRLIRARHGQRLPIVAMTASAYGEDRRVCLEAGMNDHVGKPVDPMRLYATVLHWLDAVPATG